MVRAGKGGTLADDFERDGVIGMGGSDVGDLTSLEDLPAMKQRIDATFPDASPQRRAIWAGQLQAFRNGMQPGDRILTYDRADRQYVVGTITGDYRFSRDAEQYKSHTRAVRWEGRISRDHLSVNARNSLGSLATVFEPSPQVLKEVEGLLRDGPPAESVADPEEAKDFDELFEEFTDDYLKSEDGDRHLKAYDEGAAKGRENFEEVLRARAAGEDVTDRVLSGLLPHINSQRHRDDGSWIHVAPAINKDIKSWYEGAGWATPEDWPRKAALILDFVSEVSSDPARLRPACARFSADPASKGLQSGMITPILNALRPEAFAIVNSKVSKTLEAMTGEQFARSLDRYPEVNERVLAFASEHVAGRAGLDGLEVAPTTLLDMFSHWFVAVREESEPENTPAQALPRPLDRTSVDHARRIALHVCPDAAPRTQALAKFAEAIREAHHLSQSAWSVTLQRRFIRLNVAGLLAMDLRKDGAYVAMIPDALDPGARRALEGFEQEPFLYIPEAVGFTIPYTQLNPVLGHVWPGVLALMRAATDKSSKAPFRIAHSPGVLGLLRSLGHAVPDPSYAQDLPKGTPVGEPKPGWGANPAMSVQELAESLMLPESTVTTWVQAVNRKGQAILYGPPGTGKTYAAEKLAAHLVGGEDGVVELIQFHPAYAYEDFLQGLRPVADDRGLIRFELVPGRFMEFCERAAKRKGVSVLIIDEINRANLPHVFGELMYLLEYRDATIRIAGGSSFRIPPSVRVIGTMNTADRSIALVDHALRRRFSFLKLEPSFGVLRQFHGGASVEGLIQVLEQVNETIGNPHLAIGISFFLRKGLAGELGAIWGGEIEPYLEEVFFDRPRLVEQFRWEAVRARVMSPMADDADAVAG